MGSENRATVELTIPRPVVDIHKLPEEILLQIFSHLRLEDLAQSAYVCQRWHRLLRRRKTLWRRREFITDRLLNYRKVMRMTAIMPRLKAVRLIFGARFGVHIAWPEATIVLNSDSPVSAKSAFWVLPTDAVMVSRFVADEVHFLHWVKTQTLRMIHVGEQCFDSLTNSRSPFTSYVRRRSCNLPDCLLHSTGPCLKQIPAGYREPVSRSITIPCPSLVQVVVHCVYLSQNCLERLCGYGNVRILHVMCGCDHNLSFLEHCTSQLEILCIKNFVRPSSALLNDLRAYINKFENLKVLEVTHKDIREGTINYVQNMRHLDLIMRHNPEFKTYKPLNLCS